MPIDLHVTPSGNQQNRPKEGFGKQTGMKNKKENVPKEERPKSSSEMQSRAERIQH